jgi:spastin
MEHDRAAPLQAAEHYASAIKAFQAARQEASKGAADGPELARIDCFVQQCLERFSDCEKRVKKERAAQALAAPACQAHITAGGKPAAMATRGTQPTASRDVGLKREDRGAEERTWFGSVWSWIGREGGASLAQNSKSQHDAHRAADLNQPPAKPPPKLPDVPQRQPPGSGGRAAIAHVDPAGAGKVSEARKIAAPSAQNRGGKGGALKGVDSALAKVILDEVLDSSPGVAFDEIVGLAEAKQALREAIVLPALRPDLFHGLRAPPKGILMFGPPGNGKTMLAKAVASECNCRFFSISASSLTSKWVGQSEKMVRALFAVAHELQPTVIFLDEVDSILSARSANENEASRRLKTEFLVQFDGVGTSSDGRVVVVAATNRPQELDEAVIRRFTRRILIPLPDAAARHAIVLRLLDGHKADLNTPLLGKFIDSTLSYSASDLAALCKDAAMAPLRELGPDLARISEAQVRAITVKDLQAAASRSRSSISLEVIACFMLGLYRSRYVQ